FRVRDLDDVRRRLHALFGLIFLPRLKDDTRTTPSMSASGQGRRLASRYVQTESARHSAQASLVATFDAIGEPVGGELARYFRAVQRDLREHRARRRSPHRLIGESEDASIKRRLLEVVS